MVNTLYISLGPDCFVKRHLINNLKSQPTYVFDWLKFSCIKSLIKLLKNDFNNFMNREDFNLSNDKETSSPNSIIVRFNKRYSYFVVHDFTFLDNFKEVKDKYDRRIERFKKDSKNSNTVFIRCIVDENIEDYIELYKELEKYTKKCILICISNKDYPNFNHDNIYLIKHDKNTLYKIKDENKKSIISQIQKIVNSEMS